AILAAEAGRVARVPPGSSVAERDLADAVDRLAARRVSLSPKIRALRAGIRARHGEPLRAYGELAELRAEEPMAMVEYGARARAAFGKVALPWSLPLIATVEAAIASARGESGGEDAGDADELFDEMPFLRYTARLMHAETLFRRGHLDAARAMAGEVLRAVQ